MQIEGAITDLEVVNNTDRENRPLPPSAKFKFHTKNPAQIIDVKVTPEQYAGEEYKQLQKLESDPNGWGLKPALLNLEYYEGSNVVNQMAWKGFRLHSVSTDVKV